MQGRATYEGTRQFFASHDIHPDKKVSFDGLNISALAAGNQLGSCSAAADEEYENSMFLAVMHGVNFLDTAINYRRQRSEKLLKSVFQRLHDSGISREQIVVASKGGLLPEDVEIEDQEQYIRAKYIEQGILSQQDILHGYYSLSPKFIAQELEHSLENMGLKSLDIYYINYPEIALSALEEVDFEKKIYQVIELLEQKVAEKKIGRYGFATWNGFRQKGGSKGLLSLPKLVGCATAVAGEKHHFKAIQLPLNFVMLEGLKTKNQSEDKTILEIAVECGIAVIICSPFMQSHIFNLPKRIFQSLKDEVTDSLKALQFLISQPAATAVVAGMRGEHVHENIKVLQRPNWTEEELREANGLLGV